MFKKIFIGVFVIIVLFLFLVRPSNDRNWNTDQAVLPEAFFNGDFVEIKNIRNFKYRSTTDYDVDYYDKTFDLNDLETVWYVVEPFSDFAGSAHTFLSFGFADNEYLSVSVEIRKEKEETFSALKGLFRNYEIMYVIADEKDAIKLRSNYRKDKVYLYPVQVSEEKRRELFVGMLERANDLKEKPEFYNTITNTCTTNIVSHVNYITPDRVPFSFKVLLPGYSDKLAYDLGLIPTDESFEEVRAKHLINDKAEKYGEDPDFSIKIRE